MNYPLEQARAELQLFAKSRGRDIAQGVFRLVFFLHREHVLGKKATVRMTFEETVAWATEFTRQSYPGFEPRWA